MFNLRLDFKDESGVSYFIEGIPHDSAGCPRAKPLLDEVGLPKADAVQDIPCDKLGWWFILRSNEDLTEPLRVRPVSTSESIRRKKNEHVPRFPQKGQISLRLTWNSQPKSKFLIDNQENQSENIIIRSSDEVIRKSEDILCYELPLGEYCLDHGGYQKSGIGVFHVEKRRSEGDASYTGTDNVLLRLQNHQLACVRVFVLLDNLPSEWQHTNPKIIKQAEKERKNRLLASIESIIQPRKLTVEELRRELANRGLSTKGRKDELITRLENVLQRKVSDEEIKQIVDQPITESAKTSTRPARKSISTTSRRKKKITDEIEETINNNEEKHVEKEEYSHSGAILDSDEVLHKTPLESHMNEQNNDNMEEDPKYTVVEPFEQWRAKYCREDGQPSVEEEKKKESSKTPAKAMKSDTLVESRSNGPENSATDSEKLLVPTITIEKATTIDENVEKKRKNEDLYEGVARQKREKNRKSLVFANSLVGFVSPSNPTFLYQQQQRKPLSTPISVSTHPLPSTTVNHTPSVTSIREPTIVTPLVPTSVTNNNKSESVQQSRKKVQIVNPVDIEDKPSEIEIPPIDHMKAVEASLSSISDVSDLRSAILSFLEQKADIQMEFAQHLNAYNAKRITTSSLGNLSLCLSPVIDDNERDKDIEASVSENRSTPMKSKQKVAQPRSVTKSTPLSKLASPIKRRSSVKAPLPVDLFAAFKEKSFAIPKLMTPAQKQ